MSTTSPPSWSSEQPVLIAVMGPTASGKTALAESLAEALDAQLINADASQAYAGMDIGTAKPSQPAKYRLINIKRPDESYGAGEFCRLAHAELTNLWTQGRSAVVVGGTGLYIRALFEEYEGLEAHPDPALRAQINDRLACDGLPSLVSQLQSIAPEVAQRIDLKNPVRVTRALERHLAPSGTEPLKLPHFRKLKVALNPPKEELLARIETRLRVMVHNGWVQEVGELLEAGYSSGDPGFRAIGYKEIADYLKGEIELEEATATAIVETGQYAKRQRTWLRSEPNLNILQSVNDDPFAQAMDLTHRMFT